MKTVNLTVPLDHKEIRSLDVGDVVYVSGPFYTCRTLFQRRALEDGIVPPVDFSRLNLMVHVGPVMRRINGGWEVVSFDPTSSIRFEKYGAGVIGKLSVRAIIGKTTMGEATLDAMVRLGCVHLTKVGICGNVYAKQIRKVLAVYDLDILGKTEATWVMEAENMGPFIVDMDTKGRHYFSEVRAMTSGKLREQYRLLGIPGDYDYTMTEL